MKLALMRTDPGEKDLLFNDLKFNTFTSLSRQLTAPQIRVQAADTPRHQLLGRGGELWSNCCKETTTDADHEEDENCSGHKGWTLGLKPGLRGFWFQPLCLCETQRS